MHLLSEQFPSPGSSFIIILPTGCSLYTLTFPVEHQSSTESDPSQVMRNKDCHDRRARIVLRVTNSEFPLASRRNPLYRAARQHLTPRRGLGTFWDQDAPERKAHHGTTRAHKTFSARLTRGFRKPAQAVSTNASGVDCVLHKDTTLDAAIKTKENGNASGLKTNGSSSSSKTDSGLTASKDSQGHRRRLMRRMLRSLAKCLSTDQENHK